MIKLVTVRQKDYAYIIKCSHCKQSFELNGLVRRREGYERWTQGSAPYCPYCGKKMEVKNENKNK